MKNILFIFAVIFITNPAYSQNERIKAMFIYNFTKYIEWPNKDDIFTIGVLNSRKMSRELSALSKRKKIGKSKIVIKNLKNTSGIDNCEIIYIPKAQASKIKKIKSLTKNKTTLIISDESRGINKGAGINFVVRGKKQKFEIRRRNIEKKGVKLNSTLLSLGIVK